MRLRATKTLLVEPALPARLENLRNLSRNLYWTWNTDAAALFERIDRDAWQESGHNPVVLLQRTPRETWDQLASDDGFLLHFDHVSVAFESYLNRPPLMLVEGTSEQQVIAYFSLEFALTESFPNYSGGLGVLAGDHLKSASDLGLPLVGIGLFYHEGYFRQQLSPDGWQLEEYTPLDIATMPVDPVLDGIGRQLTVELPFEGRRVAAAIWRVAVGKVSLYLLDTNIESNQPMDRAITARLYGGDNETRIQQEIVLGIGGVRALHALGLKVAMITGD
ncbi:MAG TPA: alpha-glucan family phosphorylase, partial [Tepidiformaceae bacterium]|nr:alpha-glucan family phosphorylase [Tepidiformaceae bacterium]